jgi:hypothetical protein
MKKWSICSLVVTLTALTFNPSFAQVDLVKTTQLSSFPSASTLSYYDKRLYVIGDDAPDLLILTNDHEKIQDLALFAANSKRIKKEEKADLEASSLFINGSKKYLVGISSFSAANRNKILVYDLSKSSRKPKLITTKEPFKKLDVEEPNIEGAAFANEKLLLSNRANNTHKTNYLIVAGFDPEKGIKIKDANTIKLELPKTNEIVGISGLEYVKEKDLLLFVASTESTDNATEDGAIGDSYMGYISNISQKLDQKEIKADTLLSFSKAINSNKTYKIESIAIESVKGNELLLHLASDNDDGQSTLFKIKWKIGIKPFE